MTRAPSDTSTSAIIRRWQRHQRISAHMTAVRRPHASVRSSKRPAANSSPAMMVGVTAKCRVPPSSCSEYPGPVGGGLPGQEARCSRSLLGGARTRVPAADIAAGFGSRESAGHRRPARSDTPRGPRESPGVGGWSAPRSTPSGSCGYARDQGHERFTLVHRADQVFGRPKIITASPSG